MAIPITFDTKEEENPESENFLSQMVRELVGIYLGQLQQNQSHPHKVRRQRSMRKAPKPDLVCCHPLIPQGPQDQDTFALSLEIKMEIDIAYRRIGSELRQIADGFEHENTRRRRRHPAGQQSSSSVSLSLRICLPITLLSVTLLAFLKKKL